jgi:hypothetical protein
MHYHQWMRDMFGWKHIPVRKKMLLQQFDKTPHEAVFGFLLIKQEQAGTYQLHPLLSSLSIIFWFENIFHNDDRKVVVPRLSIVVFKGIVYCTKK